MNYEIKYEVCEYQGETIEDTGVVLYSLSSLVENASLASYRDDENSLFFRQHMLLYTRLHRSVPDNIITS